MLCCSPGSCMGFMLKFKPNAQPGTSRLPHPPRPNGVVVNRRPRSSPCANGATSLSPGQRPGKERQKILRPNAGAIPPPSVRPPNPAFTFPTHPPMPDAHCTPEMHRHLMSIYSCIYAGRGVKVYPSTPVRHSYAADGPLD
jgi:hypothetical protein